MSAKPSKPRNVAVNETELMSHDEWAYVRFQPWWGGSLPTFLERVHNDLFGMGTMYCIECHKYVKKWIEK